MEFRQIPKDEYRITRWSGGKTTEFAILPENASYASRKFSARISSAVVELDESEFTRLPGVVRYISPLEGSFRLCIDGEETLLAQNEILRFDGGARTLCRGSGRDLNLMLCGCTGAMERATSFMLEPKVIYYIYTDEKAAVLTRSGKTELLPGYVYTVAHFVRERLETDTPVYLFAVAL